MAQRETSAYVAIGANLGEREKTMRAAIEQLRSTDGIVVTKVSTLIENPSIGGPEDSPPFLNGVIEISTTLSPREVLETLLGIERRLGRVRDKRWAPRFIDLDLLLFGDAIIQTDELTVPHPSMHERRFVLAPLAEIAPHVVHPILERDVRTLLAELDSH